MNNKKEFLSEASIRALSSTSIIRRIFLLGQKKRKENPELEIIDLSLGNPDLEPPIEVFEELRRLAASPSQGMHRYMDNAGFPEVRDALSKHLSATEKVPLSKESVFMTCGAAGALQILLRSLLNPGDEVVLLAPYFVEYTTYVKVHGGTTQVVPLNQSGGLVPSIAAIKDCLNNKTKLIILNSPNNPSGVVYPVSFYQELQRLLDEHEKKTGCCVQVISDEPYARVLFEGQVHESALSHFKNAWLVRSHSKDLGLAGERIGFIAWRSDSENEAVLDAFRAAARALGFVNAPALMQRLLPHVLNARVQTEIYQERAEKFCSVLLSGGVQVERPGGTFFVLPKVPQGISDDAFCEQLAQRGVLVVPAASFGAPGYFRVSLTQDLAQVLRAAHHIVSLAHELVKI